MLHQAVFDAKAWLAPDRLIKLFLTSIDNMQK